MRKRELRVFIVPVALAGALMGCNQPSPAGNYNMGGSQATQAPTPGSGLAQPASSLSGITQTGTGAIGPGQGIGVAVPATQQPVGTTTGSAQGVTSGPAARVRSGF